MPKTADSASSSGSPAATSEPNATIRISSVTGSDSVSAFLKSSSKTSPSALPALASPNCSMRRPGLAACAAATAASGGVDALLGDVEVAGELEARRAPSGRRAEIWPALPCGERGLDVRRRAAVRGEAPLDVGDRGPEGGVARSWRHRATARGRSPRHDAGSGRTSPCRRGRPRRGRSPARRRCSGPAAPPPTAATATKASQPKMAILRWRGAPAPGAGCEVSGWRFA